MILRLVGGGVFCVDAGIQTPKPRPGLEAAGRLPMGTADNCLRTSYVCDPGAYPPLNWPWFYRLMENEQRYPSGDSSPCSLNYVD